MATDRDSIQDLVVNRRARHDYELLDVFEAGVALVGSEVKSLRAAKGNLQESFVHIAPDGAWLVQFHISPYDHANRQNHEPTRRRRLLLHRHELLKLARSTGERGLTIVPLRVYLKGSRVKVEIAVARGKKLHDKRQSLKERDARMEMRRHR